MSTEYDHNLCRTSSENTVARLAAEVHRAVDQTLRVNHAVTRVIAEVQSLTGEVDGLAAEVGALAAERDQGSPGESAPVR